MYDLIGDVHGHACWDREAVEAVKRALATYSGLTDDFLVEGFRRESDLFTATEMLLKGKEISLPRGHSFKDKDGHERSEIRTRWYLLPDGHTYRTYALMSDCSAPDVPLPDDLGPDYRVAPYPADAPPIFFGHYWLKAEAPSLLGENVACLDLSVAKGGCLCAYRWHGERTLAAENLVTVPALS